MGIFWKVVLAKFAYNKFALTEGLVYCEFGEKFKERVQQLFWPYLDMLYSLSRQAYILR